MDPRIFYSLQSALVFFVIAAPFMYKITHAIFGKLFAVLSRNGCPTYAGVVLHAVVFGLIVYLLMVVQGAKEHFANAVAEDAAAETKEPKEPKEPKDIKDIKETFNETPVLDRQQPSAAPARR
jgi:hypothetical protein